ncbi:MAG: hypothetical protein GEV04_23795 [Actinophytocola sp.]|nr:hypothetical protein [Actinophytocola sp.]
MSKLDDLQSTAQQVSNDADSPLGGLGQLQSENDTAVREAVAWGTEAGAQILDGPGKTALDEAMQHLQGFQEKLKEYIDTVEQAKSGG